MFRFSLHVFPLRAAAFFVFLMAVAPARTPASDATLTIATQGLRPNAKGAIVFDVRLPKGFHLNKQAPQKWSARVEGKGLTLSKTSAKNFALPLRVEYSGAASGKGILEIDSTIYYCTDDMKACKFTSVKIRAPFQIKKGGVSTLNARLSVNAPGNLSIVIY